MRATEGPSLRERTRLAVLAEISRTAVELFDERGFDQTTVDQVAAAVGISPRSFFRYFPAKEDVVIGDPMVYGERVRASLAASLGSMPLWDALRAAFEPIVASTEADSQWALRATRVIMSTTTLRARNTEKHLAWVAAMTPVVEDALPGSVANRGFQARGVTLAALTCLEVAQWQWVELDGAVGTGELLDEAFAVLKPAVLVDAEA